MSTLCCHCSQPILSRYGQRFCSKSCATTHNNLARVRVHPKTHPCAHCGTEITAKNKFCNSQCAGLNRTRYTPLERQQRRRQRVRAHSARYRANLRKQTPKWADHQAITEFYARCPQGYEVDHIHPISKGGLHTMENLQYLPASENRRKGNKLA